jgi:hypothetical protein
MAVRLLVFLHGTVLMHADGLGRTREERVAQARDRMHPGLYDYASYVPVGEAAVKLRRWADRGAEIAYLSSHRDPYHLAEDASVLRRWDFPRGRLLARRHGESYGAVAERELPDVLIEDDCESLDGRAEVAAGQIRPELRARIKSIVVPEFGGVDHLPDRPTALLSFGRKRRARRGSASRSSRSVRELAHRG